MIADAARAFTAKLNETTPRERAGLAMLAAIAAITALVYALDWAGRSAQAAEAATQSAADNAALQAAFTDEGQRRALASDAGDVWRWSRRADAFASEEVLGEIENLVLQAGFSDARVTLLEAPAARGQVGAIEASVQASFDWASFLALLEALETAELSVSVRSIDVSENEGAQSLAMVFSVPAIESDEPER